MTFLLFLAACVAEDSAKETGGDTAEPGCPESVSAPFVGWDLVLSLCLPDEEGWYAHFSSEEALEGSMYVLDGRVTNYIYDPVSTDPLASGQLIITPGGWSLFEHWPELFGNATTLEEGVRNARETMARGSRDVSEVASTTVGDLPAWYYMTASAETETSPGSTTVLLVIEIDAEQGRVLDYSATVGGAPVPVTTDPVFWRSELANFYWPMLRASTVFPS